MENRGTGNNYISGGTLTGGYNTVQIGSATSGVYSNVQGGMNSTVYGSAMPKITNIELIEHYYVQYNHYININHDIGDLENARQYLDLILTFTVKEIIRKHC